MTQVGGRQCGLAATFARFIRELRARALVTRYPIRGSWFSSGAAADRTSHGRSRGAERRQCAGHRGDSGKDGSFTEVGMQLAPVDPVVLAAAADEQQPADESGQWALPGIKVENFTMPTDRQALIDYLAKGYAQSCTELTLDAAIAMALEHNHSLNSQRLNAAAACQGVKVNWAALRPQLSMDAKAYKQDTNKDIKPIEIPMPDGSTYTLNLGGSANDILRSLAFSLTQRIYDFGLTSDLIDVSLAQHAIQNYTVDMDEQQLVHDVTAAYLNFTLAVGQWRIREDELKLSEEFLRQARIQFDVGTAPKLDVIRAEVRVEQARDALISAQSQLGDASALFFSLLGMEDQRYMPALVTPAMIELGDPPVEVQEAVASALEHRPEIELQYSALFAGKTAVSLTRNRPVLQAYVNALYKEPATGVTGTDNYEAGIELMWNLYSGGKDISQRKQAELSLAALSEGILDLEAKVELDATTAWNRLYAARASTDAARKDARAVQRRAARRFRGLCGRRHAVPRFRGRDGQERRRGNRLPDLTG